MKIAILGTRGIPNNYGGFEQLAQCLSLGLVQRGHEVYVYNSHHHPYREASWQGVQIISCYDPEKKMGTFGQFIYDVNCILNARRQQFDIILNLGYTSSSIWMKLFPKKACLITNMDGFEWQRSKYKAAVRRFLRWAEAWAVKGSEVLVADSQHIQKYIHEVYGVKAHYIAYGAELFSSPSAEVVKTHGWEPFRYNMIVARMEPENNIEMILDGVVLSQTNLPFYVVGNSENRFGKYLQQKFRNDSRITFVPSIYDQTLLNNLRYHAHLYVHGHSVGGTNPSLLEAMGCSSFILAHKNQFNQAVLGQNAYYFENAEEVARGLNDLKRNSESTAQMIQHNFQKIQNDYSWQKIISAYEELMIQSLIARKPSSAPRK